MNKLKNNEIKALNAGTLAYLGDAIFEVLVREHIIITNNGGDMKKKANAYVSAKSQSQMYHKILEISTEEEIQILKRGRNYVTKVPKSATVSEYRHATGIEALFGYLYLQGNNNRLLQIFNAIL